GQITLPVFGLYANYANTVTITSTFTDGSTQTNSLTVTTGPFSDPCGYNNPTFLLPRTNDTTLSYDFVVIKGNCNSQGLVIVDTDGAVRWAAPADTTSSNIFRDNGFYVTSFTPGTGARTGFSRL